MSEQFKDAMGQWVEIKKQLQVIRKDVKTLNDQEKNLRGFIQQFMKEQNVTACNISDLKAKVTLNTRQIKPNFTKDLVRKGLLRYFNGDEDRANYVMGVILETGEINERDSVTLKMT
jgi:hypothetical protein